MNLIHLKKKQKEKIWDCSLISEVSLVRTGPNQSAYLANACVLLTQPCSFIHHYFINFINQSIVDC